MIRIFIVIFLIALAGCSSPAAPTQGAGAAARLTPPPPPAPPPDIQAQVSRLAGAFRGDVGLAVLDVENNSAGWRAGVLPYDMILAVGGEPTWNKTFAGFRPLLYGPKDSDCTFTLWRNGRWTLLFPHTAFHPATN